MKEQGGERGFKMVDPEDQGGAAEPKAEIPTLAFGTFVLSISTSALVQLGEAPDPETGEPLEPNLTLAQQTIDILDMLREKTRGNLDAEEQRLLESVLHDLHMRFVEVRRRPSG